MADVSLPSDSSGPSAVTVLERFAYELPKTTKFIAAMFNHSEPSALEIWFENQSKDNILKTLQDQVPSRLWPQPVFTLQPPQSLSHWNLTIRVEFPDHSSVAEGAGYDDRMGIAKLSVLQPLPAGAVMLLAHNIDTSSDTDFNTGSTFGFTFRREFTTRRSLSCRRQRARLGKSTSRRQRNAYVGMPYVYSSEDLISQLNEHFLSLLQPGRATFSVGMSDSPACAIGIELDSAPSDFEERARKQLFNWASEFVPRIPTAALSLHLTQVAPPIPTPATASDFDIVMVHGDHIQVFLKCCQGRAVRTQFADRRRYVVIMQRDAVTPDQLQEAGLNPTLHALPFDQLRSLQQQSSATGDAVDRHVRAVLAAVGDQDLLTNGIASRYIITVEFNAPLSDKPCSIFYHPPRSITTALSRERALLTVGPLYVWLRTRGLSPRSFGMLASGIALRIRLCANSAQLVDDAAAFARSVGSSAAAFDAVIDQASPATLEALDDLFRRRPFAPRVLLVDSSSDPNTVQLVKNHAACKRLSLLPNEDPLAAFSGADEPHIPTEIVLLATVASTTANGPLNEALHHFSCSQPPVTEVVLLDLPAQRARPFVPPAVPRALPNSLLAWRNSSLTLVQAHPQSFALSELAAQAADWIRRGRQPISWGLLGHNVHATRDAEELLITQAKLQLQGANPSTIIVTQSVVGCGSTTVLRAVAQQLARSHSHDEGVAILWSETTDLDDSALQAIAEVAQTRRVVVICDNPHDSDHTEVTANRLASSLQKLNPAYPVVFICLVRTMAWKAPVDAFLHLDPWLSDAEAGRMQCALGNIFSEPNRRAALEDIAKQCQKVGASQEHRHIVLFLIAALYHSSSSLPKFVENCVARCADRTAASALALLTLLGLPFSLRTCLKVFLPTDPIWHALAVNEHDCCYVWHPSLAECMLKLNDNDQNDPRCLCKALVSTVSFKMRHDGLSQPFFDALFVDRGENKFTIFVQLLIDAQQQAADTTDHLGPLLNRWLPVMTELKQLHHRLMLSRYLEQIGQSTSSIELARTLSEEASSAQNKLADRNQPQLPQDEWNVISKHAQEDRSACRLDERQVKLMSVE
ncbi:hypothetical protein CAOG_07022 [Capsaspora owczarzaki ATCC 30864]|uniref:hypothetical protein n=1 Tax=Capsaspora owczarzaki (strain ATCC 30864) TaxID=595528 RepID=UPI0003521D7A|nr:hypothetical protein CAOG_07022 [Capsaspora owczarzaki ATCC 30864]|eukprot:XP_004343746.2 hypothetical protein CAOG_07022 [Capsaspora owczarzaki ATCC 30864]